MARGGAHDRETLMGAAETALGELLVDDACELAERAVAAADAVHAGRAARADARSREPSARSAARRLLATALLRAGRVEEAERAALEAVRVAQGARAAKEQALAELVLAEAARWRADYLTARHHTLRARKLAARAKDAAARALALGDHALVLSRTGDGARARDLVSEALALSVSAPAVVVMVGLRAAEVARGEGRLAEALAHLDRVEPIAQRGGLAATRWAALVQRVLALCDVGALDHARGVLDEAWLPEGAPATMLAESSMLHATVALAAGERPELVESRAREGLARGAADATTRLALERLRAVALLLRGRADDAERIAVELVGQAGRGGAYDVAADAMALAARATPRAEAALLRWLGALALASHGVSARVEHEAMAALSTEPDPIGMLARTGVAVMRARLVDWAPHAHKAALKRTLRQVETKLQQLRQSRRADAEVALGEDTLRAKEEVGLVGSSPGLLRAIATLARAAKSDASLVITGETGSGKELFARLAHRLSRRASGPFVAINCAAIPEPLLEAELFGHERGAFTGAERARPGLFVEAQGGTLLLDEVGEMSAAMQAKLLRVLEEREVRPIGGARARKIDVRVLAATHRELSSMVGARTFREDLFYRLAAITVRVPPLRERREDIPVIARAILARDPATADRRLDVPALTILAEHAWPGNVRELANVLRVAATLTEGNIVERDAIAQAISQSVSRVGAHDGARALEETTLAALRARHRAELRELVGRAIASADGNKLRAARALGITRQGLYRVLAEYGE